MGTVNYNCPSCAAPLTFNPERQRFCCEYCLSEFSPEKIQQIYAEREQSGADTQQEFKEELHDGYVFHCDSCGAEVVATSSTAATTCFTATILLCSRADCREISNPTELFRLSCHENKPFQLLWIKQKAKSFCPKIF